MAAGQITTAERIWAEVRSGTGIAPGVPETTEQFELFKQEFERAEAEAVVRPTGDSGSLLWACRCGKGGTPNLSVFAGAETVRAETERQVIAHLREEGHDPVHTVYVGEFRESLCINVGPGSDVLWHKAGDAPDTCGPHPRLS